MTFSEWRSEYAHRDSSMFQHVVDVHFEHREDTNRVRFLLEHLVDFFTRSQKKSPLLRCPHPALADPKNRILEAQKSTISEHRVSTDVCRCSPMFGGPHFDHFPAMSPPHPANQEANLGILERRGFSGSAGWYGALVIHRITSSTCCDVASDVRLLHRIQTTARLTPIRKMVVSFSGSPKSKTPEHEILRHCGGRGCALFERKQIGRSCCGHTAPEQGYAAKNTRGTGGEGLLFLLRTHT